MHVFVDILHLLPEGLSQPVTTGYHYVNPGLGVHGEPAWSAKVGGALFNDKDKKKG
jgi:hypothetical protein